MIEKFARRWQRREKSAKPRMLAAIHWQTDWVKLVVAQANPFRIEQVATVLLSPKQPALEVVVKLAADLAKGTRLCLVLGTEHYQLLQVDKPAVPAEEMLQALPWQARELSQIPVDDMLVDYLDLPEQSGQQAARLNLVVTSLSALQPLCLELQRRPVQLENIQPEEWLPRNLLPAQSGAVVLLVHQPGQEMMLQIIKQQAVYFSRRLRGFNRIDQYNITELSQGMLDNLLLEVQRSLDYFEGQLRQAPVKEILVHLTSPALPAIVQYFTDNGFSQVRALDLAAVLPGLNPAEQQEYWLTAAGAIEMIRALEQQDEAQS